MTPKIAAICEFCGWCVIAEGQDIGHHYQPVSGDPCEWEPRCFTVERPLWWVQEEAEKPCAPKAN